MLWQKCFFLGFEVCLLCWLQQRNHCFFWFLEVQCLFWQRRSDVQNQNIHRGILAIEFLGAVTSPEQSLDGNCWHINIDPFMRIDSREAWVAWLRQHVYIYIYIWPMVEHWYIYIHRNTYIYLYNIYLEFIVIYHYRNGRGCHWGRPDFAQNWRESVGNRRCHFLILKWNSESQQLRHFWIGAELSIFPKKWGGVSSSTAEAHNNWPKVQRMGECQVEVELFF